MERFAVVLFVAVQLVVSAASQQQVDTSLTGQHKDQYSPTCNSYCSTSGRYVKTKKCNDDSSSSRDDDDKSRSHDSPEHIGKSKFCCGTANDKYCCSDPHQKLYPDSAAVNKCEHTSSEQSTQWINACIVSLLVSVVFIFLAAIILTVVKHRKRSKRRGRVASEIVKTNSEAAVTTNHCEATPPTGTVQLPPSYDSYVDSNTPPPPYNTAADLPPPNYNEISPGDITIRAASCDIPHDVTYEKDVKRGFTENSSAV